MTVKLPTQQSAITLPARNAGFASPLLSQIDRLFISPSGAHLPKLSLFRLPPSRIRCKPFNRFYSPINGFVFDCFYNNTEKFLCQQKFSTKKGTAKRGKTIPFRLFLFFEGKQLVWCAFKYCAHCVDHLVLNRFCFVIYHSVEILVAHTQLFIEPVFCLTFFL